MIECSQKVRSVCPYGETCGGGEYKEGSDCDKFAESLQNKKAHKPGGGPITREQVEGMRARWVINPAKQKMPVFREGFGTIECSKCGSAISMGGPVTLKAIKESFDFCSACGAPMTDEAVDILWKRLEAMQDAAD